MVRNLGQRKCKLCRRSYYGCRQERCLSAETKAELKAYIAANGRTWKSKLSAEWANGSEELRELRNVVGPYELKYVKADNL